MSMKRKIEAAVKQKSPIVPYDDDTIGLCQCPDCPTHEQCEKGEVVFCSMGESDNVDNLTKQGCMCPTCGVFDKYDLANGYFCAEGEAR